MVEKKSRCNQCYKGYDLLKKQDVCRECFLNGTKPYTKTFCDRHIEDGYGDVAIYIIKPKDDKYIRLHNILHYERNGDYYDNSTFKPIEKWNDIWDFCGGCHNPEWINNKKFKGMLKRGIIKHDGNGITVCVETIDHDIYYINGGWS
jgi:hypothetical protein